MSNKKIEGSIYHYTSVEGLKGIIESKSIRFTHYKFLNDPKEMNYFKESNNFNSTSEMLNLYLSVFDPFILSFSEDSDSYSLWSNYTNHYGLTIEFDIEKLRKLIELNFISGKEKLKLTTIEGRILYDEKQQKAILHEINEKNIDIFNSIVNDTLEENPEYQDLSLEEKVSKISTDSKFTKYLNKNYRFNHFINNCSYLFNQNILFKSNSFCIEKEYRFCININNQLTTNYIKFRLRNNILIPYISVPLILNDKEINPIKSITLGPKNKSKLTKESIIYFLKSLELSCIKVKESTISLQ